MGNPKKKEHQKPNLAKKASRASNHSKSVDVNTRWLTENCGCGSGKSFQTCCYRPEHCSFRLDKYLDQLKEIKVKMTRHLHCKLLTMYCNGNPSIQDAANSLSRAMKIPTIAQTMQDHRSGMHPTQDSTQNRGWGRFVDAMFVESLIIDQRLGGYPQPLIKAYKNILASKSNRLAQEILKTLGESKFSIYEVVDVRKLAKNGQNSWFMLRDVFSGQTYEYKDPLFRGRAHLWDLIVGRRYTANGFHLLSTTVFIISSMQKATFNRMLLHRWLHHGLAAGSFDLDQIEARYPNLFVAFQRHQISLGESGLYNEDVQHFVRSNAYQLLDIFRIINSLNNEFEPIIKTPDNKDYSFTKVQGVLKKGTNRKVYTNFRQHPSEFILFEKTFDEGEPPHDEEDAYEFSFMKQVADLTVHTPRLKNLKEMLALPLEEFSRCMLAANRRVLTVYMTAEIAYPDREIPIAPGIKNSDRSRAKAGSVLVIGNDVTIGTHARENMADLVGLFTKIADGCIERLGKPVPDAPDSPGRTVLSREEGVPVNKRTKLLRGASIRRERRESPPNEDATSDREHEVMERRFHEANILAWLDAESEVLGGKSPRQAAGIQALRPIVMDLVKSMENEHDRRGEYIKEKSAWVLLGLGSEL